jgi:predicted small secreted protein
MHRPRAICGRRLVIPSELFMVGADLSAMLATMNTKLLTLLLVGSSALLTGCYTTDGRVTNTSQPGPAIGVAVGAAAGAVVGNVTGAVVGAGEGAVGAAKVPFNTDRRIIRQWRTETTSDGRTIQVAYEVEVDAQGRPIGQAKPASN